jgi:signal peptidase II
MFFAYLAKISNVKVKFRIVLCVALFVVVLDQITKHLVRAHIALGQHIPEDSFISLTYTRNDGVAFSMFDGSGRGLIAVQIFLVAVIVGILLYLFKKVDSYFVICAVSLMLSGGIGNLIDRIRFSYVTDFVSVGNFPIFNVADSALTIGSLSLIVYLLFDSHSSKKNAGNDEADV